MSGTRDRQQRRTATPSPPRPGRAGSGSSGSSGSPSEAAATGVPPSSLVDRRSLDPDRLAALEEERDFLLRSLRDLEAERAAGDLDDADYVALEEGYTRRAAEVLKAIEQRNAGIAAVRSQRRRPGRRVAVIAGVVAFGIAAGAAMSAASGRRTDSDSLTGDIRQSCRQGLLEAQGMLGGPPLETLKKYDEVLDLCPANAEALTYKGWLLYNTSRGTEDPAQVADLTDLALTNLDAGVLADPTYSDARVFRASILKDLERFDEARVDFDAIDPAAIPPYMQTLVDSLRKQIDAGTGGTVPGTPPPGSAPPG